jgi:hypothetical protein
MASGPCWPRAKKRAAVPRRRPKVFSTRNLRRTGAASQGRPFGFPGTTPSRGALVPTTGIVDPARPLVSACLPARPRAGLFFSRKRKRSSGRFFESPTRGGRTAGPGLVVDSPLRVCQEPDTKLQPRLVRSADRGRAAGLSVRQISVPEHHPALPATRAARYDADGHAIRPMSLGNMRE